jgi:hypothetical protein
MLLLHVGGVVLVFLQIPIQRVGDGVGILTFSLLERFCQRQGG